MSAANVKESIEKEYGRNMAPSTWPRLGRPHQRWLFSRISKSVERLATPTII